MGTALMLFGGLLLALAGMLWLAKLVLEPEEFRLFLGLFAPGVLLACLLFWGVGALDPSVSAVNKFFATLVTTAVLLYAARPLLRRAVRGTVLLLLSLASATVAVPLMLLAVYLYAAWFPSSFDFTPPPADDKYDACAPPRTCPRSLPALHDWA